MARNRRPPADTCSKCGKTLDVVQGQRITATASRGINIQNEPAQVSTWKEARLVRLSGKYERVYLVMGGPDWSESAVRRAQDQAQEGARPWLCSVCAKVVCDLCGSAVQVPYGAGVMDDSGKESHVPILPVDHAQCVNPDCDRYGGGD